MELSDQARAHRLRVLRHQEKTAANAKTPGPAQSTDDPQSNLRLIGEVSQGTKVRPTGPKRVQARTARQLGLEGL